MNKKKYLNCRVFGERIGLYYSQKVSWIRYVSIGGPCIEMRFKLCKRERYTPLIQNQIGVPNRFSYFSYLYRTTAGQQIVKLGHRERQKYR